ncbi:MAG: hypothetical protein H6Q91_2999, partial [Deltaproteobacteria bacterium]|nr:hypothetical protein [Deltaproteobacteria bacterium]
MCGIGGFFGDRVPGEATVSAMVAALTNRGPDAQHVVRFDRALACTEAAS